MFLHLPCKESLICCAKRYGIFVKAKGYGRTLKDWRTKHEKKNMFMFSNLVFWCAPKQVGSMRNDPTVFFLYKCIRVYILQQSVQTVMFPSGLGSAWGSAHPNPLDAHLDSVHPQQIIPLASDPHAEGDVAYAPGQIRLGFITVHKPHTHIYIYIYLDLYI